jgi:hypothetical protein
MTMDMQILHELVYKLETSNYFPYQAEIITKRKENAGYLSAYT